MPFNEHKRSDSWPPTLVHLSAGDESKDHESSLPTLQLPDASDQEGPEDFEDNPFSYFLSSPEDSDDDDDEDLSAGIETPDLESLTPIVRTVSPSDFQLVKSDEIHSSVNSDEEAYIYEPKTCPGRDEAGTNCTTVPLTLREFNNAYQDSEPQPRLERSQSRSPIPSVRKTNEPNSNLSIGLQSHARGRSPCLRLRPSRRRLRADSYPMRRPHSWRRPSDDVFTIPEESFSASNSSKESMRSGVQNESGAQIVPSTYENQDKLSPLLKLGEDSEAEVVGNTDSTRPSLGTHQSYVSSSSMKPPETSGEEIKSFTLARVADVDEAPILPQLALRPPFKRRKTVRFALPDYQA